MKNREGYEMVNNWIGTKLFFHKELRSSIVLFHRIMTVDKNCIL